MIERKKYEFRKGFRNPGKLDAQKVGKFLAKVCKSHDRELWPEKTVEAAKPSTSPIHDHFEWTDSKAAHEYRLHQARNLHGAVYVVRVNPDTGDEAKERAFVHIRQGKASPYRGVEDVLSDPEWKEIAIHAAVKDLIRAKKRLERWQEFAAVCSMLESAVDDLTTTRTA